MKRELVEVRGVFESERWRSKDPDSEFAIGMLKDGTPIIGNWQSGDLVVGLPYKFIGVWETHPKFGKQLKFQGFCQETPATRQEVVEYLTRCFKGVGERTAHKLCDLYGADKAIHILKENPDRVSSEIGRFPLATAREVSAELKANESLQDTRMKLYGLLANYGFQLGVVVDLAIHKWSASAPERIRRDPFILLAEKFPGCGFLRVDRLYQDLGLPLDGVRRQVMAAWHVLRSDSSGSTWLPWGLVAQKLGQIVSGGVKAEEAIRTAVREGWAVIETGEPPMLADAKKAQNERTVAERLEALAL